MRYNPKFENRERGENTKKMNLAVTWERKTTQIHVIAGFHLAPYNFWIFYYSSTDLIQVLQGVLA